MRSVILPGGVVLLLLCAACSDPPEAIVKFYGIDKIPNTREDPRAKLDEEGNVVLDKSVLFCRCYCPDCMKRDVERRIEPGETVCPDEEECGLEEIRWRTWYGCPWCGKTGRCIACENMVQSDGGCYNCKGRGVVSYMGKARPCPNCKDTRPEADNEFISDELRDSGKTVCPVCKGTTKCTVCLGEGRINMDTLKERHETIPPDQLIE